MVFAPLLKNYKTLAKADGRPVNELDALYIDNRTEVLVVQFCIDIKPPNKDKARAAFLQILRTTPMLCSKVEGTGENRVFRIYGKDDELPQLEIIDVEEGVSVDSKANEVSWKFSTEIREARNNGVGLPPRFLAFRGPKRSAMAFVANHAFIDGMGMAYVMTKYFAYLKAPRALWKAIDKLSAPEIPDFMRMVLKKDYDRIAGKKVEPYPYVSNNIFSDYDAFDDEEKKRLKEVVATLGRCSPKTMKACRKDLRQNGITVTSVFAALSAKVFLELAELYDMSLTDAPISISTPLDARELGDWGKSKQSLFPNIANYAFTHFTDFTRAQVKQDSLVSMAQKVRKELKEVIDDPQLRYESARRSISRYEVCSLGVSSIKLPRKLFIPKNLNVCSEIDNGDFPAVWFMITTYVDRSEISLDVYLPLSHIEEAKVRADVKEVCAKVTKNTPLESLFQGLTLW